MKSETSLSKRVSDFRRWSSQLILDNGEAWELEPFQIEAVRDVLAGYEEVWLVIPEGNGKTTLMAGIALEHVARVTSAFVPVGASSREQAEMLYRQAAGFVERSPALAYQFRCLDGYRRINATGSGGRIQVYASDERTADGVIPSLALLDELHRHKNLGLYRTWRGKLEKRGGQLMAISTAGEPGSEFEETRAAIIATATSKRERGAWIRAESEGIVLHDWAVRDRSKADNMRVVAAANPRKDITPAVLRKKRASPTMTATHWQRFVCNLATRESVVAITPEQWDALREEDLVPDRTAWSVGCIDLGWRIDTTAVGVLVWESDDRRVMVDPRIIEPPVDESEVVRSILDLDLEFQPVGWVYDPHAGAQQMVQMLEKGIHPLQVEREHPRPLVFWEHTQDSAPMGRAAERFDEAIRRRQLVHSGHGGLRRHALSATRLPLPADRWKFGRPPEAKDHRRAKYPIDALTAYLMGHNVAVEQHAESPVPLVEFV